MISFTGASVGKHYSVAIRLRKRFQKSIYNLESKLGGHDNINLSAKGKVAQDLDVSEARA